MTAPIRLPARSRIGAAESWIAISCPRAVHQHRMLGEPEHLPLAQAAHDGALAGLAVVSSTTVSTSPISLRMRLAALPAGQALGDRIHVIDVAFGIGGDDRVADRLQRDLRPLLVGTPRLRRLALGDVPSVPSNPDAARRVVHHARVLDHRDQAPVGARARTRRSGSRRRAAGAPRARRAPPGRGTRLRVESSAISSSALRSPACARARGWPPAAARPGRLVDALDDVLEQAAEARLADPQRRSRRGAARWRCRRAGSCAP